MTGILFLDVNAHPRDSPLWADEHLCFHTWDSCVSVYTEGHFSEDSKTIRRRQTVFSSGRQTQQWLNKPKHLGIIFHKNAPGSLSVRVLHGSRAEERPKTDTHLQDDWNLGRSKPQDSWDQKRSERNLQKDSTTLTKEMEQKWKRMTRKEETASQLDNNGASIEHVSRHCSKEK